MNDAEKFVWLNNAVLELFLRDYVTSEQCGELQDFIDTMEERWGLWNE